MACRSLTTALIALAAATLGAPTAYASDPTPDQAQAELNAWRAQAGERPVAGLDARMSEGCRLHNAYMQRNSVMTHDEDPAAPGYTELGAEAGGSSVIAGGTGGPRVWESAVYHRMGLLEPRLVTTWFDASSGYSCMGIFGTSDDAAARTPALTLYPWPANGARGVPTEFAGGETPDPNEAAPAGHGHLGFLLSVDVNGPWERASGTHLTAASLVPDGGAPVSVTGVDSASPSSWALNGGFGVFPNQPLAVATWYTVHAAGTVDGVADDGSDVALPFQVTWRFQTELLDPGTWLDVDDGTVEASSDSPAAIRITVTRGGAAVAEHSISGHGSWRTRVAPGRYQVCAHQDEAGRYAGYDRCRAMRVEGRTTVSLGGKVHGRRLVLRLRVRPALGQRVRLVVSRKRRRCGHFPNPYALRGTVYECFRVWAPFAKRTVTARRRRTLHVRAARGDRRLRVVARVASATLGDVHYAAHTARITVRRR